MKNGVMLMLVLSISLLYGCSKSAETASPHTEKQMTVTVVAPKSPAAIPILRMIEVNALGDKVKIDLQLYTDMEKMMVLATGKNYGFLAVPVHTAATLYNKGLDIKLVNITSWGGMYLSTTDPNCSKWEDLRGEKLYVPAKGSVPDIMTQHFLNQHGLIIGDSIEIVYSNHNEIAQLIKSGTAKHVIDAEPFVTANKDTIENYRVISDFTNDWKKTEGDDYSMPNFGLTSHNNFLVKNKELVKTFNKELEKALKWAIDNPDEAGVLTGKYLNANPKLIEKAMPNFNFFYRPSLDVQKDIEKYYSVLAIFKPESIGGKIPDENFYYKME